MSQRLVVAMSLSLIASTWRPPVVIAQQNGTRTPTTTGTLVLGETFSGSVNGEDTTRWLVPLHANEYAEVDVRPLGRGTRIRLLAPDGHASDLSQARDVTRLPVAGHWIARGDGTWAIDVTSEAGLPRALYEIRWSERHVATAADHERIEADSLTTDGLNQTFRSAYDSAAVTLRRALAIRTKLLAPDDPQLAVAMHALANVLFDQTEYAQAETLLSNALTIRKSKFGSDHAETLLNVYALGLLYDYSGQYEKARPLLEGVLARREKILAPDDPDVAQSLAGLGSLQVDVGREKDAEPLYRRAIAIQEQARGPLDPDLGTMLNDFAILLHGQGRLAEAVKSRERALAILQHAYGPAHAFVAQAIANLGMDYLAQGRSQDAERLLREALATRERILSENDAEIALNYSNLGMALVAQAHYVDAEDILKRAITLTEKASGAPPRRLPLALNNLAALYNDQGRYEEAEPLYLRALEVRRRVFPAVSAPVGFSLTNLATLYLRMNRLAPAESLYREALPIQIKSLGAQHPDVAWTEERLADLLVRRQRYSEAEALYRNALAIREAALGTDHPDVAETLTQLAALGLARGTRPDSLRSMVDRASSIAEARAVSLERKIDIYVLRADVRRKQGDRAGALSDLRLSLRYADQLRPQVSVADETRAAFFGRYASAFDRMIAWQLDGGNVAEAFGYAERARARVLLDQLTAGGVDIRADIPPSVRQQLEANESSARARMSEFQERYRLLREREDIGTAERDELMSAAEDSLFIADRDFREAFERIREASPVWRALVANEGESPSLDLIQRRVVPSRGLFLMYHVGERESFLFVIPPLGARPFAMPLTVRRSDAARLGVPSGSLTVAALSKIVGDDSGGMGIPGGNGASVWQWLSSDPKGQASGERQRAKDREMASRLHALWRVLVPAELWPRIRSASELVVAPGRGLYLLPFESLVVVEAPSLAQTKYWIDLAPPVRYAASASSLLAQEQRAAAFAEEHRVGPTNATGMTVLSLTDPTFRSPASGSKERDPIPANETDGLYGRLPATEQETEAVVHAYAAAGGTNDVEVLKGAKATEARFRAALPGKRVLHLATHGIAYDDRSSLYAALIFAPGTTGARTADDDGFLQLYEIYRLQLSAIELAVLSACRTNAGAALTGEGVFTLSRGFLAAGAARVVASEWDVSDASTAALIGGLFQGVARQAQARQAVEYARILRDAKLELRRSSRWQHPFYWAPFVLAGIH